MINKLQTFYLFVGLLFCKCSASQASQRHEELFFPLNSMPETHHVKEALPEVLRSIHGKFSPLGEKKKILNLLHTMVVRTKQIEIPGYPEAHNPSIIPDGDGYLLTFRLQPSKRYSWISYIGIVRLNKEFQLISDPQLINPRIGLKRKSPSQAEDARIFTYKGEAYLIYNDNEMVTNPSHKERRDIYVAKLMRKGPNYWVAPPVKLIHEDKYSSVLWQKNWTPFVWNDNLMISYTFKPHEVLLVDIETGICKSCYEVDNPTKWQFGEMRGGSPALYIDGHYLTFYHSGLITKSKESRNQNMHHYYMGALTFNAEPPFEVTKMTPAPIVGKDFYTISNFHKRIVYPGGFVVNGNTIHVVYGKDDSQVWVATIDKKMLEEALLPPHYDLK